MSFVKFLEFFPGPVLSAEFAETSKVKLIFPASPDLIGFTAKAPSPTGLWFSALMVHFSFAIKFTASSRRRLEICLSAAHRLHAP